MVDKINTELNVITNVSKSLSEFKGMTTSLKESSDAVKKLNNDLTTMLGIFRNNAGEMKNLSAELKFLSQGTKEAAQNRAALTGVRSNQKGSVESVSLALAKDELSIRKQMAQIGEKLVDSYRQEARIKQGISDLGTLQYQRELALSKIAQISLGNEANKKKLLGDQAIILRNVETGIRSMEQLEKNRVKYQKEQEAQRKKEIVDAQKLLDLETRKQNTINKAKGVDPEGKPLATASGANIITAINRKSMAELLVVQTKLLLNYQLIGSALASFQFGTTYVLELDKAFTQLQAIGDLTNTQMQTLRKSIIDIGNDSRFTAVEVAQAGVVLAQAGYSGEQIKGSLKAITLLATAAGTDLKQAVDVVTSVINVFGYQVDQSTQIANIMTAALNESKLSMEQLGLGIQYASNIAADANISFSEMVASFGVLSDAGIRSGSTIGTGYRQLINDLQNPSEKLKTRLAELGLGMDAISIKSKGLAGVIRTLGAAGYSTVDALQTLEVRAASTFAALAKGVDDIELTEQSMLLSTAAIKANEIQMQSLDSVIKQFQSNFGSLIFTLSQGLVGALTSVIKWVTSLVQSLSALAPVILTIVTLIGVNFVFSVATLNKVIAVATAAFVGMLTTMGTVAAGLTKLQLLFIAFNLNPAVAAFTAVGVATLAAYGIFRYFTQGLQSSSSIIEASNTKIKEAEAELEKYEQRGRQVTTFLEQLRDKHTELTNNTQALKTKIIEAKLAFDGLGGSVISLSDNYETLVVKVGQAKAAIFDQIAAAAQSLGINLRLENVNLRKNIEDQSKGLYIPKASFASAQFGSSDSSLVKQAEKLGQIPNKNTTEFQSFTDVVKKLSVRLDQITDEKQREFLTDFIGKLNQQVALSQQIQSNDIQLLLADRKESTAKTDASITGLSTTFVATLSKLTEENRALFSGTTDISVMKAAIDAQETQVRNAQKTVDLVKGLPGIGARLLKTQSLEEVEKQAALGKQQLDLMKTAYATRQAIETEEAKKKYQIQGEMLRDQAKTVSVQARQEIVKQYADIQKKMAEVDIAKLRADVQKPDYVKNTLGYTSLGEGKTPKESLALQNEARDKALKNGIETILGEMQTNIQKFETEVTSSSNKYNEAVTQELLPAVEDLKNSFEDLKQATENQIAQAGSKLRQGQIERDAYDIGDNRFNITDAERRIKDRANEQLDGIFARDSLNIYLRSQEEVLKKIRDMELQKQAIESKARDAGLTNKDLAGTSIGTRSGKNYDDLKQQYKSATDALQAMRKELDELGVKIPEVQAKSEALLNPEPPKPVWDVFTSSLNDYMTEQGRLANSNAELGRSFERIFGDIKTGFGTVVKNFATGTKSIGASFRDMATSIIENMLDIASQRAASSIFDTLFGSQGLGISSLLSGSVTKSPVSSVPSWFPSASAPGLAQGGIVRGGVPNRDSVLRTLMPGEGVLTKTAVSMLGEDTVNALNSSGSRVTAQSAPRAMNDNQANAAPMEQRIYLVDERSKIPGLSPQDVVMIVGDNLAKNGSLKKSIRSAVS